MNLVHLKKTLILFILFSIVFIVILGHWIGDSSITSFGDDKVSMKFVTAFLFLLSTFSLIFKRIEISISIIVTCIYVYSSWAINSAKPLFLPIFESKEVVNSLEGDIPSWMTLIAFVVFALAEVFNSSYLYKFVIIQAIVAFLGHMFSVPLMYYYIDGFSTGEAINTSVLFIHLGSYRLNQINVKTVKKWLSITKY